MSLTASSTVQLMQLSPVLLFLGFYGLDHATKSTIGVWPDKEYRHLVLRGESEPSYVSTSRMFTVSNVAMFHFGMTFDDFTGLTMQQI